MKIYLLMLSLILSNYLSFSQNDISIGKSEILHSDILNEDRQLEIHLPKNYNNSDKEYPVMYLLDSYYNFTHTVGVTEFLYLNRLIPEMIIVGVRNTHRNRDLTTDSSQLSKEQQARMGTTGGADHFISFFKQELIPHIEKKYKAAPYRIIVGHSLGGLFNVYTFFKEPNLFNAYLTISPSLWYPNSLISEQLEKGFTINPENHTSFYMTLATENSGTMRGNTLKLSGTFENYKITHEDSNLRFKYQPMQEESHGSTNLPSLYKGLKFIFEPTLYEVPKSKEEILALGGALEVIEKTKEYYKQLSQNYGFEVSNEYALTDLGYSFLRIEEYDKYALKAFQDAIDSNPNSYNAFSNLGKAYENLEELEQAKQYYEKALKMVKETGDPEWEFYQVDLENLKKKIQDKKE
ncbi:alpha/beta hydrolase-fold protein [Zunongwangia pacifica]|uniref:Esterase n=1 Tax=Zunongwangia pacifica TaxID=2911062 RepID=A0A9X1ZSQ6_9FLAO|nr:alpha/beta hydrolase-fold protein [Zunongwangia pacifica]MCL6220327.1 esterase [Zunongwangia pacifica]